MLVYDLKRAFRPQWLWVSVWIMLMIAAVSRLDTITEVVRGSETMEAGWTLNFIQETLTGEQIFFCLPVLCAFPYASSFIDEYQSGMVKFSLTRTKKRKLWLISKASVTALSGGSVLATGVLAVTIVSCMIFMPLETAAVQAETAADISWTPWLELLMRCFCFGAVGSVTGLWLSSAVNNRYMAWIGPFMAMYLLVILYERYFSQYPVIYPREWLALTMGWPWNGWSACVFMLLLTLLAAWAFYQSADRRLKNV